MDTVQENPTLGIWGQGRGSGRGPIVILGEPQGQANHTMKAQGKWRLDRGGLEGPGEELEEASLCGHKGATERPGRQRWPWASGRLAWLRSTGRSELGELAAGPVGVQAAMPEAHASHPPGTADQRVFPPWAEPVWPFLGGASYFPSPGCLASMWCERPSRPG